MSEGLQGAPDNILSISSFGGQRFKREQPFPTDLPSRRERILSSFNIPLKSTIQLMIPPSLITREDLAAEFAVMYGVSSFAGISWATAQNYCFASLVPIGLIAEEVTLPTPSGEVVIGFSKTAAGARYGDPVAARFLAFEAEHRFPLYPILGKTGTNSDAVDRAPGTRSRVLQYLLQGEKTHKEIEVELNLPRATVSATVNALIQAGVVEGQSVTTNTGRVQVEYTFNNTHDGSPVQKKNNWSQEIVEEVLKIAQLFGEKGLTVSQDTIYQALPAKIKDKWKEKNLRDSLNNIISGLADQSLLVRGAFKGKKNLSRVKLTEKGMLIVSELLKPLDDALQDGESLTDWTNVYLPAVRKQLMDYATQTAETFYPFSMTARNRERGVILNRIVDYIAESRRIPSFDITEKFGLNRRTIDNYLQRLVRAGQLKMEQEKSVNYYMKA